MRTVIFDPTVKDAPVRRDDARIRYVPFMVDKPTFEVRLLNAETELKFTLSSYSSSLVVYCTMPSTIHNVYALLCFYCSSMSVCT